MSSNPLVIASIAAKNYLPRVRAMAHSLRAHHPRLHVQVLLSDQLNGEIEQEHEPFELVQLAELGLVEEQQFCFRYDLKQRSSALKPFYLDYLLDQGYGSVLFLDPDMLITASLTPLLEPLASNAIMLTPHLLRAAEGDRRVERELEILRAGVFNAGVIGVTESASARRFLGWWKERLSRHARDSVEEGMYYDQRWLDLVPSLFTEVHIVRDPGCNIAHWNLTERKLSSEGDALSVEGQPCRLVHFSGYDPGNPETISGHADWYSATADDPLRALMACYRESLLVFGQEEALTWVPAWEHFANGCAVKPLMRELYATGDSAQWSADPFACDAQSFFAWLVQPVDERSPTILRVWDCLLRRYPHLQALWPDHLGEDRASFNHWIHAEGLQQFGFPA
ncbi:MAG: hypothetical protein V4812_09935 [Pseudomonadota bacterium]